MSVQAIRAGYHGDMKDRVENFHGQQLLGIGWDQHLMYAAPHCIPVPPTLPFGALLSQVLPQLYGAHPEFGQIDWATVHWRRGNGERFEPQADKSLAENGIGHKDMIRFRTPGLEGLYGIGF
jgi:phenol hydroxylase P4 protein